MRHGSSARVSGQSEGVQDCGSVMAKIKLCRAWWQGGWQVVVTQEHTKRVRLMCVAVTCPM
jgi:hypothetical protein